MRTIKRNLVGVAVAAASLLGTGGLAEAATPTAPAVSASTSAPGNQLDVGVPPEGVHPDALVTAPDGTKISATSAGAFGKWRSHGQVGNESRAIAPSYSGYSAMTTASNARIRASVPNGRVVGMTWLGEEGDAGCKIPGSDGHLWGWVGLWSTWTGQYTSGWMRGDLFKVFVAGSNFWGTVNNLPWC